jgi:hypothetical protein
VTPRRLVSLEAYNGGTGSATVTVGCAGQLPVQAALAGGQFRRIRTGWTGACADVTIGSSNGWNTNFDNLVVGAPP